MTDMYIKITLPEEYEDVHPELVLADVGISSEWQPEFVGHGTLNLDRIFTVAHDPNYSDEYVGNLVRSVLGRSKFDGVEPVISNFKSFDHPLSPEEVATYYADTTKEKK